MWSVIQPKGLDPKGLDPKGLDPKRIPPKRIQPKGFDPKRIQPKRVQPKRIQPKTEQKKERWPSDCMRLLSNYDIVTMTSACSMDLLSNYDIATTTSTCILPSAVMNSFTFLTSCPCAETSQTQPLLQGMSIHYIQARTPVALHPSHYIQAPTPSTHPSQPWPYSTAPIALYTAPHTLHSSRTCHIISYHASVDPNPVR